MERAQAGEGPTLIESYTYRMSDHTTSDDATRYRTEQELKYWTERDPIARFSTYLVGKGLWDDAKEKALSGRAGTVRGGGGKEGRELSLRRPWRMSSATPMPVMPDDLQSQLERHRRDLDGKEG